MNRLPGRAASGTPVQQRSTGPLARGGLDPHLWLADLSPAVAQLITQGVTGSEGVTMRRIGDRIEPVGRPVVTVTGPVESQGEVPQVFRWRGRRYVVGSVLAHWVETGAWWRSGAVASSVGSPVAGAASELSDPEREMWRVEALRGTSSGVFDLCRDDTGWSLRGVHD